MSDLNWKDSDYLDKVERYAEIASKSRAIADHFFGDKETCMMLIMQGDDWGVKPQIVLANSFYDQYGRIQQTGLLMQMILARSPEVQSIRIDYLGNWEKIINKSSKVNPQMPNKTWQEVDEVGCGIQVEIALANDKEVAKSVFLTDINEEYKALNPSWVLSPKKQLFNHVMRDLGNYELRTIVNGYDTQEASFEHSYNVSLKTPEPVAETKQYLQPVTEEELAMFSPTSSEDENSDFSEKQSTSVFVELKAKLEDFFDTCNDFNEEELRSSISTLSSEISAAKPLFDDSQLNEIKELYVEVQKVVSQANIK